MLLSLATTHNNPEKIHVTHLLRHCAPMVGSAGLHPFYNTDLGESDDSNKKNKSFLFPFSCLENYVEPYSAVTCIYKWVGFTLVLRFINNDEKPKMSYSVRNQLSADQSEVKNSILVITSLTSNLVSSIPHSS